MPDDPALAFGDVMLGSLDTEILVVTTSLFDSGIKHNEIVNQLQKALLTADSAQVKIEFMLIGIGNFFFPLQIILFRGFNGAVTQALGIITCHHQLLSGKEVADKVFLLIIQILANALRDGNR